MQFILTELRKGIHSFQFQTIRLWRWFQAIFIFKQVGKHKRQSQIVFYNQIYDDNCRDQQLQIVVVKMSKYGQINTPTLNLSKIQKQISSSFMTTLHARAKSAFDHINRKKAQLLQKKPFSLNKNKSQSRPFLTNIKQEQNPMNSQELSLNLKKIKNQKEGKLQKSISSKKSRSPYITRDLDLKKVIKLLRPVSGVTESLKLQIRKYNELNFQKIENNICIRINRFEERMKAYSIRLGFNTSSKIFIMNSRDLHIKKALINRGWVESCNKQSCLYHLKWVYTDSNADYSQMQQGQFYNHFKNNQQLTNKNLLRQNIKKAQDRPCFPLSFDIEINKDFAQFEIQFSKFQILSIFKDVVEVLKNKYEKIYIKTLKNSFHFKYQTKKVKYYPHCKSLKNMQLLYIDKIQELRCNKIVWDDLRLLHKFFSIIATIVSNIKGYAYSIFEISKVNRKIGSQVLQIMIHKDLWSHFSDFYLVEIFKLLKHVNDHFGDNYGINNIWILKPTGVSKGSGITITSEYGKIMQSRHGKIVQKYIQNPLLLNCNRKFDIRQWVLVKSTTPLVAYIFDNCYARFCSQNYSNQKYNHTHKHLTNYHQNKDIFLKQKEDSSLSSVMSQQQLSKQIGREWPLVKARIMIQIYKTLTSCCHRLINKDGCFEVFGVDIILDLSCRVWILQVNMSPACDPRQLFLEDYLSKMGEGITDMLEGKLPQHWRMINKELIDGLNLKMNRREVLKDSIRLIQSELIRFKSRKRKQEKYLEQLSKLSSVINLN